ncbi:hypothetical protein EJ04DRAFT_581671 [Polyplosphaeria fusca]|uniref:Autophagy-related protein 11 n=1 Tax=Polyplosphaeria fusca TaxID=682080 RepID=A0A9P4QKF7_9PLEO|nr:hypothetical protein EJ04DRAFT_581671 [Polyplosphaeria fusca]
MSLQIAVAHTGQRLDADPVGFSSIEALKHWISNATQIPPEYQILLTPRGKHVKLQALLTEKEIFVYNRDLSTGSHSALDPTPLPDSHTIDDPPDTLSSHTDLKAWQALFQARRDWAFAALASSHAMSTAAAKHFAEQATIEKGTQIAVGNHDSHIRGLGQKHQAAKEWFEGVEKETGDNLRRLDGDFAQLASIPAKTEFVQFLARELRSAQGSRRVSSHRTTLQEFLDTEAVKKATNVSRRVRESFGKRIASMAVELENVTADYNELVGAVGQSQSRSLVDDSEEPPRLYNEIDAVAKKVESDFEHVMELPPNSKSVAQVSKMALLHTRNFLPAVKEYSAEMSELVRRSVEQKNLALRNAVESMRSIATIESVISNLSAELDGINIPEEGIAAFELISLVSRLPFIYGTLLVEALRRYEWSEKMKQDTSSLAEEMAGYQEEEERRRKKWLKPIADVVNLEAVQGNPLGFEINVQSEKSPWPSVTREDLQDYLKILQRLEDQGQEAESLAQAIKDLDRPTKQQIKRAKNFKLGSVHEPAFGKSSQLMLRGEEESRVLKEANAKLEDELKSSKGRIRRLEDLLHRQNHTRLSIGGGLPTFGPHSPADPSTPIVDNAPSPRLHDEMSRRSSISSRRFSTNQGQDDKRRIVRLEQELTTEKAAREALEKEAQSKKEAELELTRQVEEAVSTKENIMENMKAQQREFAIERRSLEEEIQSHKGKIEEAEDELDRILGSRDHERTGVDAKLQELVNELDRVRKDAAEQATQSAKRIGDLQSELNHRNLKDEQHHNALAAAFAHLSSNDTPPAGNNELIAQLEDLAERSFNHQQELRQAVAMAKSENDTYRTHAEEQAAELKSRLNKEETAVTSLQEQVDMQNAKITSINEELEEERGHLRDLRDKFAEGETGSEALRKRVAEEEARVGHLHIELAEAHSHANSLDVELTQLQKKLMKYEDFDSSRSQLRASRAKEVSQRLYAQHDRLLRLLESLGFVVTYEEGSMALQRASKVGSSTMIGDDKGLNRSVAAPSPTPLKAFVDDVDLSFLQWSESTKPEEEDERYHELLDTLSRFQVETFSDAVSKRMRDMEHTARKWQKEARAYRDKSHRFQAEGHEKIAFRSFKEGDLALFLPTRNQATRPWAAFNVGAPHYFLREQDGHRLAGREWLVARISKVEERVVDLSKTLENGNRASLDGRSIASNSAISFEDDNPFELSDGLRWYLLDAAEEKAGAPGTPGLGRAMAASVVRATGQGHMDMSKKKASNDPAKTLNKSLESRRSSGTSRNSVPLIGNRNSAEALAQDDSHPNSTAATRGASPATGPGPSHLRESEASGDQTANAGQGASGVERLLEGQDEVRKDLLWGP